MKKFVKIFALSLAVVAACLCLAACDPSSLTLDELMDGTVASVELINYDNPEQKSFVSWVPDHSADLKPFDGEKASVVETLSEDKIEDFVSLLGQAVVLGKYYSYDSPKGICLKVTYSDGKYLIVNCNTETPSYNGYIGEYSADGEVSEFFGCFESYSSFSELVNTYFEYQVPTSK